MLRWIGTTRPRQAVLTAAHTAEAVCAARVPSRVEPSALDGANQEMTAQLNSISQDAWAKLARADELEVQAEDMHQQVDWPSLLARVVVVLG